MRTRSCLYHACLCMISYEHRRSATLLCAVDAPCATDDVRLCLCVCVFECVLYMCEFFTWAAYWNIGMNAFKFRLGRGDSEKRIDARVCCIEEQRWQLILFYICVWILIGLRYNRLHGIHAQFLKIHFRSSFGYTLRLEDDMIYFSIVIRVYRSIFWTRNHIRN